MAKWIWILSKFIGHFYLILIAASFVGTAQGQTFKPHIRPQDGINKNKIFHHGLEFPKALGHYTPHEWNCSERLDVWDCMNGGVPFTQDKSLGFSPTPGAKIKNIAFKNEFVAFDVTYTHHKKYRRRITPGYRDESYSGHSIFAGCSLVYGAAINDDETLPYFFGQQLVTHRAYNYGISGTGPHVGLAQLQNLKLGHEVKESKGHYFYLLADFHVPRANGFMQETSWWGHTPYYRLSDKGRPVRAGSFLTGRQWVSNLYLFFKDSLKFDEVFKRNFPARAERHDEYTCALLAESQRIYKNKVPKGQFWVVRYPYEEQDISTIKCLEKKGVNILRVEMPDLNQRALEYIVPIDGHPTGKMNKAFAKSLYSTLVRHPNFKH